MNEVERTLVDLGRHVEVPPQPDLSGPVAARLGPAARKRRRWPLAVALAVLALVAAALAIPPARSALQRLFGLGGVEITRVQELPEQLPAVTPNGPLQLGERVSPAQAADRVQFDVLESRRSPPERTYFDSSPLGGRVSFLYGSPQRPRLLVTEFAAEGTTRYVEKLVGAGTEVERTSVRGRPALWLHGAPHAFLFLGRDGLIHEEQVRLAGNVLVWAVGDVTLRLEADVSQARAVAIAKTFR